MDGSRGKVKIVVDGKELVVEPGVMILEAARENDVYIPTLCHHPALTPWGGCRLCMVEVDGAPKLVASCITPVRDGMQVVTRSERVMESRKAVLEFLFSERNHNCMFCPQSGACELQKLAYEMQMDHLTVSTAFEPFPTDVTNEHMVMDHNRCVLCGRCVRGCSELAGNYVLNYQNRGPKNLVGMDLNERRDGSTCLSCGLCMQLCPTGAITSRTRSHYAVKGHEGPQKATESVCTRCGLLCPIVVTASGRNILKIEGSLSGGNGRPDRGQLCYKGRFEVLREEPRLARAMVRDKGGSWKEAGWEEAIRNAAEGFKTLREKYGKGSIAGFASSSLSNEELLFFRDLMEGLEVVHADTLDGRPYRSTLSTLDPAGSGLKEASWRQIGSADFVLVLGANPYESHPLLTSLMRKGMLERGLQAASMKSDDNPLDAMTLEVSVAPGREIRFMETFLASATSGLGGKKPAGRDTAAILNEICPKAEDRERFFEMVRAFLNSKEPLVIAAPPITETVDGVRLAAEISRLKGFIGERTLRLLLLKPSGNSAGSWKLGIPSRFENGKPGACKGALVLLGGIPEPNPIPDFLDDVEFLVVVSPYRQDAMAQKAHVLLPRPSWSELDGTFTSVDGQETARSKAILDPPEGVKDALERLSTIKTMM